ADNWSGIWEDCNRKIAGGDFRPRTIIEKSKVRALCTTDDPCDDLRFHRRLREEGWPVGVYPTFRPDYYLYIDRQGFADRIGLLEKTCGFRIRNIDDLKAALRERLDFFARHGCFMADHAFVKLIYREAKDYELSKILAAGRNYDQLTEWEVEQYKSALLVFLAGEYARRGWAMQIHVGAIRDNNKMMYDKLGPDTGFDAISDDCYVRALSGLLNAMNDAYGLPKTILYNLNPGDNEMIAAMMGCFQGDSPGKIQFGPAWWFCDQKDGMLRQMTALAALGLFGRFIGMLTDSRSVLSYTRHEYFRRLLCRFIGQWVEDGEYPWERPWLDSLVRGICFDNAWQYFAVPGKQPD
ncbi:MAG: glucuronate isomerase, partial [Negativicutes bacterium]|nr:glucuronate isomerase [Negativicutes bacterium]